MSDLPPSSGAPGSEAGSGDPQRVPEIPRPAGATPPAIPGSPESAPPQPARRPLVEAIREEVGKVIVGQQGVLAGFLAALLADGHVLLEGVPGVAKTLLVKAVAAALDIDM